MISYYKLSAIVLIALISGCQSPSEKMNPTKPNFIFLMADDLGFGDVAYNGNLHVQTPVLDQMAESGIQFTRFYAAAPVCTPTRVSCLTGRHPARVNMTWAFRGSLPDEEITMAEALKEYGYTTGHFGKWHVGQLSKTMEQSYSGIPRSEELYSPPWENGFDVCFSVENSVPCYNPYYLAGGDFGTEGYRFVMDRPVEKGQREGGFVWRDRFWTGPGQFHDDWLEGPLPEILIDQALAFIDDAYQKEAPFLALIWFSTPHTPVVSGNEHRVQYHELSMEEQHWYGSITAMDEQIGRLRQGLKTRGLSDNTVLWFCSDNGPSWIHDLNSAGPYRGKKGTLWEGGIRVPAILEWPGLSNTTGEIATPITTSDFLPTILEYLSEIEQKAIIPENRPVDGISVLDLLSGKTQKRNSPIGFQAPVMANQAQNTKSWSQVSGRQIAWMQEDYKIISLDDGERWELYDMVNDSAETTDIAKDHPDILRKMVKEVSAWIESCQKSSEGYDY
ncbi:MAG: sulfatase-like hydrolase/transferase [Bacteroidetes bacterium]|jgi:arylsulfatase A-like enzyme|nr:sulfatase-like hydrolase/transferase [Bacteroidota bacterium]